VKAVCPEPELWRKRYEGLRGQALEVAPGALSAPALGRYLLRNYGIAEWMRRWPEQAEDGGADVVRTPAQAEFPQAPLWQEQLTKLLAQMAFQQLSTG